MAELPSGIGFRQVVGVAMLAGVGFTMSIFVANLAFFDQEMLLDSAKTGVLAGSLIAGVLGFFLLRFSSSENTP
ncbi:MAG: Na+/H+ antiporter NhaA [Bacteroidetes bacterium]|nr:Na+/H+ antiporter NhaA [Bacteroidota bacterium]